MNQQTTLHLEAAARNRDVAQRLLGETGDESISPEWAVVVAFYAAVHLINGYLWETLRIRPRDHTQRTQFVSRVAALRPIAAQYQAMQDIAFDARYVAQFRITQQRARDHITERLAEVESVVKRALDPPTDESTTA